MDLSKYRFAHHKLDAYRVASEIADLAEPLAARFGDGHRKLADQLRRSADGVAALIGEGANRYTPKQKRQPRGAGCPRKGEGAWRHGARPARSPATWSGPSVTGW